MKSEGMQQLIKKIFSDEESKAEFISNPQKMMAQFKLTEQEKTAVMKTHDRLGLVTSDSQALEAAIDPAITWT